MNRTEVRINSKCYAAGPIDKEEEEEKEGGMMLLNFIGKKR